MTSPAPEPVEVQAAELTAAEREFRELLSEGCDCGHIPIDALEKVLAEYDRMRTVIAEASCRAAEKLEFGESTDLMFEIDADRREIARLKAENEKLRQYKAEIDRENESISERAKVGWANADIYQLQLHEKVAERDRLRAFLLEATGTLPAHGFADNELGDPWPRWLERVAAYLTETHR